MGEMGKPSHMAKLPLHTLFSICGSQKSPRECYIVKNPVTHMDLILTMWKDLCWASVLVGFRRCNGCSHYSLMFSLNVSIKSHKKLNAALILNLLTWKQVCLTSGNKSFPVPSCLGET